MPARYVLCPVVGPLGEPPTTDRQPKVAAIADPGRPLVTDPDTGQIISSYVYSAIISDGVGAASQDDSECLCLVAGHDMSALDADPEIVTLFEVVDTLLTERRTILDQTPRELLNGAQRRRLERALTDRGTNTDGLTDDTECWRWAARHCERIVGRPLDIRKLNARLVNER